MIYPVVLATLLAKSISNYSSAPSQVRVSATSLVREPVADRISPLAPSYKEVLSTLARMVLLASLVLGRRRPEWLWSLKLLENLVLLAQT